MEPMGDNATEPATTGPATTTTGPARPRAAGAAGATLPDRRIKAMYDSPEAAARRIPELRELSKLISASPDVSKLLQDRNLVATIFAPNNAVSSTTRQELGECQCGSRRTAAHLVLPKVMRHL
jgi:hypothetical protein